jgi:hypothetical protein
VEAGVANLAEAAKHGIEINSAGFPQAETISQPPRNRSGWSLLVDPSASAG